jgi:hypothetical protein
VNNAALPLHICVTSFFDALETEKHCGMFVVCNIGALKRCFMHLSPSLFSCAVPQVTFVGSAFFKWLPA